MLVRLLSLIAAVVLACASAPTRGNASWTQSEAAHRYFAASITNSRGLQTEIDFMVYDEASEELPLAIRAPEGMTITFDRDAYGKPKSITRSGTSPAVSATRRYVYDANQRLCMCSLKLTKKTRAGAFGIDLRFRGHFGSERALVGRA
ncbi:MAG: hypothetical protein IPH76_09615 [Xanthomonadales bacterium]|nr:hypothetical protein [Xanthomonadales bacterium]